ncbi:MAG: PilZ domain-containing protein [Methyloglobulus sp.]|nr:PilZ domain-containing protein [Methyloglobulus sp.]
MSELATTESERRQSPRFNPSGLKANIWVESHEPSQLEGDVIDISFTGIKIRLKSPVAGDMVGKIRIDLFLPDTCIPFSISGILKHRATPIDLGIRYIDSSNVIDLDKFMFECEKLVKS